MITLTLTKKTLLVAITVIIVLFFYAIFLPFQTDGTLTVVIKNPLVFRSYRTSSRGSPSENFRILNATFTGIKVLKSSKALIFLDLIQSRDDINLVKPKIEASLEDEKYKNWISVINETLVGSPSPLMEENTSKVVCTTKLPPGKYTHLQITMGKLNGFLLGSLTPSKHPHGGVIDIDIQGGDIFKIETPFIIKEGKSTKIIIDLDLEDSIISIRESFKYKADPSNMIRKVTIEYS